MFGLIFEARTPLGFSVRCTRSYWEFIVLVKHPILAGQQGYAQETLEDPDEVRKSRKDPAVYIFYRRRGPGSLCAVVRQEGSTGFLITAYPTDAIKAGESIWIRSG